MLVEEFLNEQLESFGFKYGPLLFAAFVYVTLAAVKWVVWFGESVFVPQVTVEPTVDEAADVLQGKRKFDWDKDRTLEAVPCWDPATLDYLGDMPAMNANQVLERISLARTAQQQWAKSSFPQRRHLLRIILRFVVENAEAMAKVACRDSGKTMIDAMFGEILVTCEKLRWTISQGEQYLTPQYRDSGIMNLHKTSRVEYVPVGVVGAIIPWNYPCHNVFNPLIAALFSGNALVIKASEYASWSTQYYQRVIQACLAAAGAPPNLVQFVTGYREAGETIVAGNVDKVIFVGSVGVGKQVMRAAASSLTPVILELGGKDPFIVCEDADAAALAQLACRGVFQNMGQNCAGPERFIVYDGIFDEFCRRVVHVVEQMRFGEAPLSSPLVDCGACCMPQSIPNYQRLVDDAVARGARVLCGGQMMKSAGGQFYPPTVVVDVHEDSLMATEEIFGPIMCVLRVANNSDEEAIRLANKCNFGLGSCAHSKSPARAAAICARLEAGMASVNDLEGTTYLSQSLPFGGVKHSGFGRFAGPEGLRGFCHVKSVCENRFSLIAPSLPAPIAYPATGKGVDFAVGIVRLMYGYGLLARLAGVAQVIIASLPGKARSHNKRQD